MLELLKQESFVELTVREILWGYENKLIQLSRSIFPEGEGYPFDEFGLFKGKNGTVSALAEKRYVLATAIKGKDTENLMVFMSC